jgi:heptosyltransferase II
VLLFVLNVVGWSIAHTPEPLLRILAAWLGDFIFYCLPRRRRLVLSNLHHAFPEQSAAWHRAIGRESCRRLIETALLSLATPFLDDRRYREIVFATPELLACFAEHQENPAATLFCSPHLAGWEAQTAMPLVVPGQFPEFGIIFRPLDNAAANRFVTASRERFGMRLLSRKEGFAEALRILRRRGFVGILFDQNAGLQGALTLLFDRVCSTTELPGLMAEKFNARVYGIFPRHRAFWRIELGVERIHCAATSTGVTIGLNRWLEQLLRGDPDLCASWLWVHDRWRNQDMPQYRFRLDAKRNLLAAELETRVSKLPAVSGGRNAAAAVLPRRTRIWIRLPNWLGDVVIAVPLLRALRASRPDAEITLVARPQFLPLFKSWQVADRLYALPPRGSGYFAHFKKLRAEFPDVWLLFTNSARGDFEAWLTRTRQRFGIVRPGKRRPLLTHAYDVPPDFDERAHHQLELWENFLRHFGLAAPLDRTPLLPTLGGQSALPIGLICGSENMPEKRWPVAHWRAVIDAFPDENFLLFGTASDAAITSAVGAGFGPARVRNLAGQTDLPAFAEHRRRCRLLVSNDTGGMHLANALGVPLVALFGPTNPTRTAPVFSGPVTILRPATGASLVNLAPTTVIATLHAIRATPSLVTGH